MLIALGVAALIVLAVLRFRWRSLAAPDRLELSLQHVLVTGGSSGIGKAVAEICAQKGASVSILARNQARLDQALAEIEKHRPANTNTAVVAVSADVTDAADVARAVGEVEEQVGRPVDVMVCSAGATNPLNFEDLEPSDFDFVMRVNFLGVVNCVKAVLPGMKERRRGRLVFVSSQVGQVGMFGYTAYASSKFAVRGFAECLYPEVRPHGIHVSVSYPPDTDTPMYEEEMKLKPPETRLMSESGSVFTAEHIAGDIVDGLEHWRFAITHGFDGKVLGILSGALAPTRSMAEVALEALSLPILRLVWVFMILSGWYGIADQQHRIRRDAR